MVEKFDFNYLISKSPFKRYKSQQLFCTKSSKVYHCSYIALNDSAAFAEILKNCETRF
jgi:uncharacterized protein (DUF2461 family)